MQRLHPKNRTEMLRSMGQEQPREVVRFEEKPQAGLVIVKDTFINTK